MLKSWLIQNFKPILDSGELTLAPVTVLAGRNSSGKSSLIQSMLIIAQTLSSRILDRALLPNGPIVQLGTFEDILSEQTNLRTLVVSFELEMEKEEIKVPAKSKVRLVNERLVAGLSTNIQSVKVTAQFRSVSTNSKRVSAIEASKVNVESVSMEVVGSSYAQSSLFSGSETSLEFSLDITSLTPAELDEFLKNVAPEYLRLVPYATTELNYLGSFKLKSTLDNTRIPDPSLVSFSHFLPARLIGKYVDDKPGKIKTHNMLEESPQTGSGDNRGNATLEAVTNNVYVENLEEAVEQIVQFFTSRIRYLGPLRADPQSAQRFAPSSELDDVGAKGEYAAAVYNANQNASIQWYNPFDRKNEQSTLKEALDTWVNYLGVANEVKIQVAGQSGVSWQVVQREGHKALPLTAVGVGVSQILPILVMGLLAPDDTLLLVEQPELHLHPSVQARLGDFFMGLAKCGKQCLIETHSENLVSQLRYHIVQTGGQENSDCLIYFVDQDAQGAAKFNPIEISPQGNILNWPDGFFDETMLQEDRITAASLRKRAKKASNG